jgi:hypothetical protein
MQQENSQAEGKKKRDRLPKQTIPFLIISN